jgi:hypothetical protein
MGVVPQEKQAAIRLSIASWVVQLGEGGLASARFSIRNSKAAPYSAAP